MNKKILAILLLGLLLINSIDFTVFADEIQNGVETFETLYEASQYNPAAAIDEELSIVYADMLVN